MTLSIVLAAVVNVSAANPRISVGSSLSSVEGPSVETLAAGFENPPAEARARTWWHWMNRNITKEGITRDLEAMRAAGLGGATILDISELDEGLSGKVKTLSPEWFDCVQHAVAEAKRLGLDLSVANCPGWSSSGGPWIRPEHAMKNLGSTETTVEGGRRLSLALKQCPLPRGYGRDVAVLAFPAVVGDGYSFAADVADITYERDPELKLPDVAAPVRYLFEKKTLLDGDWTTQVVFQPQRAKRPEAVVVELKEARTMRGMVIGIDGPPYGVKARFRLSVSDDGKSWTRHFVTDLLNSRAGVVLFPSVTARFFRLEPFDCSILPLSSLVFTPALRIPQLSRKAFYAHTYDYPDDRPTFAKDVMECPPEAAIDPDRIVDLTDKMDTKGNLVWEAPAGKWTIMRFTMFTRSSGNHPANPEGRGLECDKLSAGGAEEAWRGMMKPIVARARQEGCEGVVKYTLIDSYEVGPQNWTEKMPEEFRARRGYDLRKFLPVFTGRYVKDSATSERFLEDFRRTVSDLYATYYGDHFRRIANADGVQLELEPYCGPFDELLQGKAADVAMGEFWRNDRPWIVGNAKLASNVADVNGRRYVQTETFTAGYRAAAWTSCPATHKLQGDYAFAQGVNRFVFHSYAHQAYETTGPGITMGVWGFHFNRHNTLWNYYRGWLDYVGRAQYLLQQGHTVADVLYVTKEDTPVSPHFEPATPYGWNANAVDARTFVNDVRAVDGCAAIPCGRRYAVVVLPQDGIVSPALLKKAETLLASGVAVVRGPKPARSFGLAERDARDRAVAAFAEKTWGALAATVGDALKARRLQPDFAAVGDAAFMKLQSGKEAVQWLHRQADTCDLYFVANIQRGKEPLAFVATFRATGEPELWDAETGTRRPAPVWRATADGRTEVAMNLPHGTSVFVVFPRGGKPTRTFAGTWPDGWKAAEKAKEPAAVVDCSKDWKVSFQPNRGAPTGSVAFETLKPLNEHAEPGIRYFSGTATYRKTITIPSNLKPQTSNLVLDLGNVYDLARVKVNGRDLGILWHYPFRVDVAAVLKPGENVLEIEVANRWINRLIGDEQEPEVGKWRDFRNVVKLLQAFPEGYVEGKMPEGHYAFTTLRPYTKRDKLVPAGLVGPVRIVAEGKAGVGAEGKAGGNGTTGTTGTAGTTATLQELLQGRATLSPRQEYLSENRLLSRLSRRSRLSRSPQPLSRSPQPLSRSLQPLSRLSRSLSPSLSPKEDPVE